MEGPQEKTFLSFLFFFNDIRFYWIISIRERFSFWFDAIPLIDTLP